MQTRIAHHRALAALVAATVAGMAGVEATALTYTCVDNTQQTVRLCVGWDQDTAPVEDQDFSVDWSDPNNPDVELAEGDLTWRVWSSQISQGLVIANANVGALSTPQGEQGNFVVAITGAEDVGSVVLTVNAAYYTSLVNSGIDGDLNGNLTVQKSSGGSGGVVHMTIDGAMTGDVKAKTIEHLEIGGDMSGDVDAQTVEHLSIGGDLNGSIDVGTIAENGDLTVTGSMVPDTRATVEIGLIEEDAVFDVGGSVGSTAAITIGNLTGSSSEHLARVLLHVTSGTFGGDLTLTDGVPQYALVRIYGETCTTTTIDLNGEDVGGQLLLHGGDGDVVGGGEVLGVVTLGGDFAGVAEFDAIGNDGEVSTGGTLTGTLTVSGKVKGDVHFWDVSGNVSLTELNGGTLDLSGVEQGGSITVSDMSSNGEDYSLVRVQDSSMNGTITLSAGIPASQKVEIRHGLVGVLDLKGAGVAGTLDLSGTGGGGGARINNGGAVTGYVRLADAGLFWGVANFASVSSTGAIHTTLGAALWGTLNVSGAVNGAIVVSGNVISTGTIAVEGTGTGTITIGGDAVGDITAGRDMEVGIEIEGNLSGDIDLDEDLTGTIHIGGELQNQGRILVDGLCDNDITVDGETEAQSQIVCVGGIGDDDTVKLVADGGDFDANGDIVVGDSSDITLDPVVFDGNIMIVHGDGTGGRLNGDIDVWGCHDNYDVLDICVCADECGGLFGSGAITLHQEGCDYTTATWDCVTGCDCP